MRINQLGEVRVGMTYQRSRGPLNGRERQSGQAENRFAGVLEILPLALRRFGHGGIGAIILQARPGIDPCVMLEGIPGGRNSNCGFSPIPSGAVRQKNACQES